MRRDGGSSSATADADNAENTEAPSAQHAWSAAARRRAVMGVVGAVVVAFAGAGAGAVLGPVSIAGAESPTVLAAEELADDGVYIAPGNDQFDEQELAESVNQARALGLRLVVVAPDDPQPDAAAFARRVQEASDVDAAIVFAPDGGIEAHVIDELESAQFRAIAAAREEASPVVAVDTFAAELLAEPSQSLPPIVRQVVLLVLLLAFILAGAVAIEQHRRRSKQQRPVTMTRTLGSEPSETLTATTTPTAPTGEVWPGTR